MGAARHNDRTHDWIINKFIERSDDDRDNAVCDVSPASPHCVTMHFHHIINMEQP